MGDENINISEILSALKKRYKLIIGITLLFTLVSGLITYFVIEPKYETAVKVFIGKEENENTKYDSSDVSMYQKLMNTYAEFAKSKDLISDALNNKNINKSAGSVKSGLTVTPREDTQILKISYIDTDSALAYEVLNAVTETFVKESKELIPNGNVNVIEKAELPKSPISPNKKLNILIAFVLGLMVSFGLCLLLEFMDNTFKSKEEVEKYTNITVIGIINEMDEVLEVENKIIKNNSKKDRKKRKCKNKEINNEEESLCL